MSAEMTSMSFEQLMDWVLAENASAGTVFGVHRPYKADPLKSQQIFGRNLETPIGPAAGPHSQLAQNIIAAYYTGCRFFELKTVQIMDGAEMAACIARPCIRAEDEAYNCEWSTELYIPEAMDEYIKAWVILHIISREYGLGAWDGFQFNISVGYDLKGIQSPKIDTFINGMMEAKDTYSFQRSISCALAMKDRFKHVTEADILAIPSDICNSATISTLHGCPPQEIESIADYLLKEKHLNTFVKCNPTLLGYDFARKTMDDMGYDYVEFGDFHFKDDLQYKDAVPMLQRLMDLSGSLGLQFGVKLTNTFPVDVKNHELPSEEMYMSGKSLYALTIELAARLSREFGGKLRIAYSGGADYFNIGRIIEAGIWPVTMATTLLKPGGYQRCKQIAELLEKGLYREFHGVNVDAVTRLAEEARSDRRHMKCAKELPSRKTKTDVPLIDCFMAPCEEGCPIHQDITNYVELAGKGDYAAALRVILEKNPLPFLTGTICAHNCMTKCTRNFYEESVDIRGTKLLAAEQGYESVIREFKPADVKCGIRAAVVGGGPTGISAAHFLLKAGAEVSIFEKSGTLGGIPRDVIPDFRIQADAIEKDIEMIRRMGADIHVNTEISSVADLKKQGYQAVILALGASKPGSLSLKEGTALNALEFLHTFKTTNGKAELGRNVAVIGGGNTAMDTARAAKRNAGVEKVSLVYRRTKRYMPADEEELQLAVADGVEFCDLLAPVRLSGGSLECHRMELMDTRDESGRRKVRETEEAVLIPADTVIVAVGEKVPTDFYRNNHLDVDSRGCAVVNSETLESSVPDVYVAGDGLGGPATAVEGIRDARKAAEALLGKVLCVDARPSDDVELCYKKKGILADPTDVSAESERCLKCNTVCENCVDVCPNRANISIQVPGMRSHQIIHVDYMCNECGNCKAFCPYASAPFKDKFTLFADEADMYASTNSGFTVLNPDKAECKVRLDGKEILCRADDSSSAVNSELRQLMKAVCTDYRYLLTPSRL